jgi:hypothetical protein
VAHKAQQALKNKFRAGDDFVGASLQAKRIG